MLRPASSAAELPCAEPGAPVRLVASTHAPRMFAGPSPLDGLARITLDYVPEAGGLLPGAWLGCRRALLDLRRTDHRGFMWTIFGHSARLILPGYNRSPLAAAFRDRPRPDAAAREDWVTWMQTPAVVWQIQPLRPGWAMLEPVTPLSPAWTPDAPVRVSKVWQLDQDESRFAYGRVFRSAEGWWCEPLLALPSATRAAVVHARMEALLREWSPHHPEMTDVDGWRAVGHRVAAGLWDAACDVDVV